MSVVFSLNTHKKNILIYRRYAALSGARLSGVDKRLGVVSVAFYEEIKIKTGIKMFSLS